ncbi:GIY-YIG nuclease family protein [Streptococcus pneumoniae]|uniref:GIY-YIG nuclease family protein n=1 Tax=Streptococcus pneumoniae TaxID=1313 RepID=UPI0005DCD562|nr:GIY-YIG nuclease family protein [Streptococcus pneumoniae]KXT23990.1 hypothetical protein AYO32_06740 [Streptococcus pneumoniae]CEY24596.1 group I intron endonuclease [Streptococcus pneumoniae]CIO71273.1 group I intron endonuclease [Streptococcus pneumoniae]CIP52406.1 group I intron endonuclease [Streptococcus pneumoniae]CIQ41721.1 group I intron endonuclease [Streptococcus pneumoniae]
METVVLQEILNIQNPEDFYVKLNKIDQFGIDTKSLYINDQPKLLEQMGYLYDTLRKTNKPHFNYVMDRPYTIHLIPYDEANKLWLFVGAYSQSGTYQQTYEDRVTTYYKLNLAPEHSKLKGRLIVKFERPDGSQHVRIGLESATAQGFKLHSILEREISSVEFQDYRNVRLTYQELKSIIKNQNPTWKTALSHLNAIYLQTDTKTGKQYVGSAYGKQKLWGRWTEYVEIYHGVNKALKELFKKEGASYFEDYFTYMLLEVLPSDNKEIGNTVISRESWWKIALQTREFGYNCN